MRASLLSMALGWTILFGIACDPMTPAPPPLPPVPTTRSTARGAGTDADCSVTIEGRARSFFVHVPASYTGQPLPLVLDLHGTGSSRQGQRSVSGWIAVADRTVR